MLLLVEGPAGAGKSRLVEEMIRSGEIDIQCDLTQLWAALRGMRRDASGKFPVRSDLDPAIRSGLAAYLKAVAVRQALRENLNVAVTTSSPGEVTRWQAVADEAGTPFQVRTVDPGRAAAAANLADEYGELEPECETALSRWYS